MKHNSCPNCGSENILVFYELSSVPVQSVLLMPTREMAVNYPKGDILLGFCEECGFIYNTAFDPTLLEYSSTYESTQAFSPTFNVFARNLATRLIDRYDLHDKVVLEIGCGNGEFLSRLCELGHNRGIGFDPAYEEKRTDSEANSRITYIKDYFSEKYTGYKADFVCCRMTLEHIQNNADIIGTIRNSIGKRSDTIVFFQVPNVTRLLRDCLFEDIYYEHCSYFSPGSLTRLFRKCGFNVLQLETDYDDQYLMLEAKPGNGTLLPSLLSQKEDLEKLKDYVSGFPEKFESKFSTWQNQLNEINVNGHRAVLWGSSSKGVSFLTTLKIRAEIKYVVDINPYRQGTYMAGTGQEIVTPDFLKTYKPDFVIVMNPVYREEIEKDINRMGLSPKILTL
ncbi:MAG: class I SAM-dependent methyltransferase [Candidatus Scalinduaceae bacterium]